jgi:hypothetical protein
MAIPLDGEVGMPEQSVAVDMEFLRFHGWV